MSFRAPAYLHLLAHKCTLGVRNIHTLSMSCGQVHDMCAFNICYITGFKLRFASLAAAQGHACELTYGQPNASITHENYTQ
jgi:hypothetical protein